LKLSCGAWLGHGLPGHAVNTSL